jgi:hypothetical protein
VADSRITPAECGGEYAVDLDEGAAGSICLTALNAQAVSCDGPPGVTTGIPLLNAIERDCLRAALS